jgi:hypothetical protein
VFLCLCNNNPANAPVPLTVAFSSVKQTVNKNSGSAKVDVVLSAASKSDVTIPFTIMSGSTANNYLDYTLVLTPIVIPSGGVTGSINLSILNNDIYQISKTVILQLGTPTNAVLGTRIVDTVVILDTTTIPTISFSSAKQVVAENAGTVNIEVALSSISQYNAGITVTAGDGSTAISPQNYSFGSNELAISSGSLTGNITFSPIDSSVTGTSKTVIVRLGAPTNAKLGAIIADTVVIVSLNGFSPIFKFADNELPGWIQDTNTVSNPFTVWKGEDLVGLIDGGADLYVNRGCMMSMYQNLVGPNGPDSQVCTVAAMLCGTSAQADTIFAYQKFNNEASVTIPQFDTSVAIANGGLFGNITVFAHYKTMYFELALTGYYDQNASCLEAEQILKILESKTY